MRLEELRSPWDSSITSHESDCRQKTANSKFIISEVMSFVCLDSCKIGITREKELAKGGSVKPLFSEYISGFKFRTMRWNFQSVKCMRKRAKQEYERKIGGQEAKFQ